MRIYDFETFEENCKNIKAVKFNEAKEIPERYNKEYFCWGKKFKANFVRKDGGTITIKIYIDGFKRVYATNYIDFNSVIEYVEINNSIDLEIE